MGSMMTTTWFAEQPVSWPPTHQLVDFYHLYGGSCLFFWTGPAHMAPNPPFSRLLRHARSYSGPILTPDPQGVLEGKKVESGPTLRIEDCLRADPGNKGQTGDQGNNLKLGALHEQREPL